MNIVIRTALLATAFSLFATQALHAGQTSRFLTPESAPSSQAPPDSAYAAGTRALNEQRWQDSIGNFEHVIDTNEGNRTDAALYWKAYALNKLSKRQLALATCDQLRSKFGHSSWNKDCSALAIELRLDVNLDNLAVPPLPPVPRGPVAPLSPMQLHEASVVRGSDEDLKLLALNSLLHQDPARAIPLLRGILMGNQSLGLKKQALFVLAQSKSPEAQPVLHDAVTGKLDPALQRQAIQMMGVFQGKRNGDTLVEVYRNATDAQIKKAVIEALFIAQDAPRMVDLARSEKDLQLKRSIVSQLALMNDKAATDYMLELLK